MAALDYGLLEDIVPNKRWTYDQPLRNGEVQPLGGKDYSALVRQVTLYRIHAGLPIGDVEHDICEVIRARSPQNDVAKGRAFAPRIDPMQPIGERLRQWLGHMKTSRPRMVSKLEALERANICKGCPQNIRWKSKCDPCNERIEQDGKIVRRHVTMEVDAHLNACRLHHCLLSAAIFIDPISLPKKHEQAPEGCWMPTHA